MGHSAHVTNVSWTPGDTHLVSVGGADTAVMVWAHGSASERANCRGDSDDSDTDSEEEGGKNCDSTQECHCIYVSRLVSMLVELGTF